ncbi:pilus assembly protein TadG-related protein [Rhodosalinus sp.]|uniref:pilus assembly protein TadG-related protein n=1 Tax=Rhodosalinus sp. TaxID=2047741 RepID=UPI003566853B
MQALRAFRRAEDGALAVWSIFMLLMMLTVGALGVDIMLAEMRRAQLQSTLDRAVLAAADLDQEQDPEAVVRSYLARAGLEDSLDAVEVTEGLNFRNVAVSAEMAQDTILLGLLGQDSLPIATGSTAEEAVSEVEVSLVLDISGSMGSAQRLPRLKDASEEFADILLDSAEEGAIGLSVVPYATQVSAGAQLMEQFDVSDEHDHSHCVNFEDAQFDQIGLDTDTQLERAAHFDPFSHYTSGRGPFNTVCRTEPSTEIMPFSHDGAAIKDRVNDLTAGGNTSIDIGVKWGAALLDPSTRPAIDSLIQSGMVSTDFTGRPRDLDETDVLKVLVVMTDGQNTTLHEMHDDYRSGPSDFWIDPGSGRLSFETEEEVESDCGWEWSGGWSWVCNEADTVTSYFIPDTEEWRDEPWGGDNAVRLDYGDLWSQTTVRYHAYMRYLATGDPSDYYAWDNEPFGAVSSTLKDQRLSRICEAAKDEGIIIYTVGFEVNDHSAGVLEDCASSVSHFFRVEGLEISSAFSSIARQVRQVRLVE